MHTWVIGAGGLLGGALLRQFPDSFVGQPVQWSDPLHSVLDLQRNLEQFRELVGHGQQPWTIIWAAGHATVSSSAESCATELQVFTQFMDSVASNPPAGRGTFFLTSSAGGVYAGSVGAPFTADSAVNPMSEYGRLKRAQEEYARSITGIRVIIGRISNLYGPGQDLTKLQGLVSRLVTAGLDKQTVNIFVPLDTLRDFIYVEDAAATVASVITDPAAPNLLVIASGEPKSLGTVIAQVQDVLRIKIPIAYGVHSSSAGQSADLRLTPTVPNPKSTPFPVGVKAVISDLLDQLQNQ